MGGYTAPYRPAGGTAIRIPTAEFVSSLQPYRFEMQRDLTMKAHGLQVRIMFIFWSMVLKCHWEGMGPFSRRRNRVFMTAGSKAPMSIFVPYTIHHTASPMRLGNCLNGLTCHETISRLRTVLQSNGSYARVFEFGFEIKSSF